MVDSNRYISYGEIEIYCRGINSSYNRATAASLVGNRLIVAFADGNRKHSAICAYKMQKIKLTFWYNIDRCRMSIDTVGLPHIGHEKRCINVSYNFHLNAKLLYMVKTERFPDKECGLIHTKHLLCSKPFKNFLQFCLR